MPATRMDAPRSKSEATSSGSFDSPCVSIYKRGHFKRLSWNHVAVADASGDDESAHVVVFNPMPETFVFGIAVGWKVAVAAHDY